MKSLKQKVPKELRTLEELCRHGTSSGLHVLETFHKVQLFYGLKHFADVQSYINIKCVPITQLKVVTVGFVYQFITEQSVALQTCRLLVLHFGDSHNCTSTTIQEMKFIVFYCT